MLEASPQMLTLSVLPVASALLLIGTARERGDYQNLRKHSNERWMTFSYSISYFIADLITQLLTQLSASYILLHDSLSPILPEPSIRFFCTGTRFNKFRMF